MPPLLLQGILEQWKARIFVLPSSFKRQGKPQPYPYWSLFVPYFSIDLTLNPQKGSIETESKGANRQFSLFRDW